MIPMTDFSLTAAAAANKQNDLKDWVIAYLSGPGNNPALAQIVSDTASRRITLQQMSLADMTRICGPEKNMKFTEDTELWEHRVADLRQALSNETDLPPLIVTNFWGTWQISDGAHRHEALLRSGFTKYWTIILERNLA